MAFALNLKTALQLYWRSIFALLWPTALLPLIIINNIPEIRCSFVILVMTGYWITECLGITVTAMIPMALFPLMGIMDAETTLKCYFSDTNMLFFGGLVMALAVEYSNLHTRISLYVINIIGCSLRRLHISFFIVTVFISMWISNSATTTMMIPIITKTLKQLEDHGVFKMYDRTKTEEEEISKPTPATTGLFISVAYASSLGGLGTLIGSGTNVTFKGILERIFPNAPLIDFGRWTVLNTPIILMASLFFIIWLQVYYLGLFRPKSQQNLAIIIDEQGKQLIKDVLQEKRSELGTLKFHEIGVLFCFCVAIVLWIFRKPQFITGWAELIASQGVIKDGTVALIIVFLLFLIPSNPSFIHMFTQNPEKRPSQLETGLITWKYVHKKLPWGLIFLIGGGFTLAEGIKSSGLGAYVVNFLGDLEHLNPFIIAAAGAVAAAFITQFASNVACCNIVVPILAEVSVKAKVNPIFVMYPAATACSFAFCMAVSTPPNSIAMGAAGIENGGIIWAGLGATLISLLALFAIYPWLSALIFGFNLSEFPEWAWENTTSVS